MSERRSVLLLGPFTDAELQRFADLLHEIDATRPEKVFAMLIDEPLVDRRLAEGAALVEQLLRRQTQH